MRLEYVEEYEGIKEKPTRFKMLIEKYESNIDDHHEEPTNKKDKPNEKSIIDLQRHLDPTNNNPVERSNKEFQIDLRELLNEVEEMFAMNFHQYSACIDNKESRQSEIFDTNTIKKKELRADIEVLEEKLFNLQTMVRFSEVRIDQIESFYDNGIFGYKQDIVGVENKTREYNSNTIGKM